MARSLAPARERLSRFVGAFRELRHVEALQNTVAFDDFPVHQYRPDIVGARLEHQSADKIDVWMLVDRRSTDQDQVGAFSIPV